VCAALLAEARDPRQDGFTSTDSHETRSRPPLEEKGAGEACLVFVEGEQLLGLRVPLLEELLLGRDPECGVCLFADDVSRRHARIVPDGAGHLVVDLDSTNGTWVNGVQVHSQRLRSGDRIRMGVFVARYVGAGDTEGRQLATLAEASRRDALTSLPNRRAFEEELAREVARASRSRAPLAVAILDVDRFKSVNDQHGHAAGDEVLRAIVARVGRGLRAGDFVARIGGEEFALLWPGADLVHAAEIAERVRASIAGTPMNAGGRSLSITVSLGCAMWSVDETTAALLARADACLYEAKRTGRNRVVW
jgi:two-component system cell cycle response regulator